MALTLNFTGAQPGQKCELFHGSPYTNRELRGNIDPLETKALDANRSVTFSSNPGSGYAIRLLNQAGLVTARSNTRALTSKTSLIVMDVTVRIKESEFARMAPKTPFTTEDTTVDKLAFDFVGDDLRVFGHVLHDGVFDKKFTFDYRFRAVPVDIPVWTPESSLGEDDVPEDTIIIDTSPFNVNTDRGGHAVVVALLKRIMKRKIRKTVQSGFHAAILKAAGESALHPVVTLTAVDVVDGSHVDLKAGILADALG